MGCEHDWRVNPFLAYASWPPAQQHVCAKCNEIKIVRVHDVKPASPDDPRTWPKA